MKNFLLKHKIAAITVSSILILALIAGIIITANIVTAKNKPNKISEESTIGKAITTLIAEDKLGTYLTAPATDTWWATLDKFNPSFQLDTIKFSDITTKPTMLGWSSSYAEDTNDNDQMGLNTNYLAFSSAADAEEKAR